MLRLVDIRKSFGATPALKSVSLEVRAGEVHALVGENGAGKSTLVKILSGAHRADAGAMELDGRDYRPESPHDARRKGVAMIYQELNLALHLSARENILLGAEPARGGWINRRAATEQARQALAQLGHADLPLDRPVGDFGIAEQQVVEIARALAIQPKVLILDEPTSSLGQSDTERLFSVILRLRAQGVALVYISHFLEECFRVADRYTVLKDGETVGTGPMGEASVSRLIALMTGREVRDIYPAVAGKPGRPALRVTAAAATRLAPVNLEVREGEIFGLAGLIGAGRTELLRAIFGLDRLKQGEVCVAGAPVGRPTPPKSWDAGVGFLSENRKEEGLMLNQSLADNLTLSKLPAFARAGWLDRRRQFEASRRWMGELAIKASGPGQAVAELSGGNQQKVALARLLEHPARVFLLDEPTRGIDVGSKAEIYRLLAELAARGKSILLASSYLPELLGLCHTIGVMCRGRLAAVRPRPEWSEAEILRVATGSG